MIEIVKKLELAGGPIYATPGDTMNVTYTGEYDGKHVVDKKLISHECDECKVYTHVAIIKTTDECGHDYGWGAILLGDNGA